MGPTTHGWCRCLRGILQMRDVHFTIGDNTVLGAASLVTEDAIANTIGVGSARGSSALWTADTTPCRVTAAVGIHRRAV